MTFTNPKRPVRRQQFVHIGRAADVPHGATAIIELDGGASEIALYNLDGTFYATENFCPHRGAEIIDGVLDAHTRTIICPLHAWRFSLTDGECLTEPNCKIETYEVVNDNGNLKIKI